MSDRIDSIDERLRKLEQQTSAWKSTFLISVSVGALFAALFGFAAYQIDARTAIALGATEVTQGTVIQASSTFSIEIRERPKENELRLFIETDSAVDPIVTLARLTGFPPIAFMKARGETRDGKLGINLNIHFSGPESFTYDKQAMTLTILQPGARMPFEIENIY